MTMTVQVVSPERILWSGEAEMVTARTIEGGDISFQTGHAPFVGALQSGRVTIRPGDADPIVFAVHGGFVEVSNDEVSVLSDVSEASEQIDIERAQAALANARAALAEDPFDPSAADAVRRAEVRLDVAGAVPA
jgi:F-type H+-transporting ATPase subunit epsilon